MHEWAHYCDKAANHQLPIAVAFWIIQIVSIEECPSLMQNLMQICCSTHLFWMQWPHSTHAHSMASTTTMNSTAKSLFTHAHSSPLSLAARFLGCHTNHSCYTNNGWTFPRQAPYNCKAETGSREHGSQVGILLGSFSGMIGVQNHLGYWWGNSEDGKSGLWKSEEQKRCGGSWLR